MAIAGNLRLLLGQKNQLWWDLPARESLEFNAKIYGIPPRAVRTAPSPK